MSISDFFIIYLACGTSFGVYFFLQNRKKLDKEKLRLKSFLTVFVWFPYAFRLLHDFATKRLRTTGAAENFQSEEKLREIELRLSRLLLESSTGISLFEFREVFERYAGLTLAFNAADKGPSKAESEIFRVALRENTQLGAKCLHRRNHLRLDSHQTLAREDFLRVISKLKTSVRDSEKLRAAASDFFEILGDLKAQEWLDENFNKVLQSADNFIVKDLEKEVWKSNKHKPLPASQKSIRLQALTTTARRKTD